MSVVIDTNVVISALLFGGPPGKLRLLWQNGKIEPVFSKEILDEYLKVLTYPRFSLSEIEIDLILKHELLPYFKVVDIPATDNPEAKKKPIIEADPDDDKFLLCALADKCRYIISGDKHLLELKVYENIEIITPATFLFNLKL